MAKSAEKLKAFELRREGKSIKEIAVLVGVTKDTASKWLRALPMTDAQARHLQEEMLKRGYKGSLLEAEVNRNKKIERIRIAEEEAKEIIKTLSFSKLFYLGLGLYWGEGTKAEGSALAVTNSDPKIIQIMICWFTKCLGVQKSDLSPRVFISNTHIDREEKILEFWIEKLGIPREQFKKMIFLEKGKKIYENREVYYGVLALRVAKGTDLKYKILAFLARIAEVGIMSG
jgi:transcriptional regulator with XRE-family HTH domain